MLNILNTPLDQVISKGPGSVEMYKKQLESALNGEVNQLANLEAQKKETLDKIELVKKHPDILQEIELVKEAMEKAQSKLKLQYPEYVSVSVNVNLVNFFISGVTDVNTLTERYELSLKSTEESIEKNKYSQLSIKLRLKDLDEALKNL